MVEYEKLQPGDLLSLRACNPFCNPAPISDSGWTVVRVERVFPHGVRVQTPEGQVVVIAFEVGRAVLVPLDVNDTKFGAADEGPVRPTTLEAALADAPRMRVYDSFAVPRRT